MPIDIHDQQHAFMCDLGRLLMRAIDLCDAYGLRMAAGETWRSPERAARNARAGVGISNSLHIDRLAFDLLLKDQAPGTTTWRILHGHHEAWRELGRVWKSLNGLNRWGASRTVFPEGDFTSRHDPGHFSSTRGGRM